MRVVNHRQAAVHLPIELDENSKRFKNITLHPGVNEVDDDIWAEVEDHPMTKAFIKDEHIEVGRSAKPQRESVPSLKEYVDAGYEPKTYLKRFPDSKKASDKEIEEAQKEWDAAKAADERAKRGSTASEQTSGGKTE